MKTSTKFWLIILILSIIIYPIIIIFYSILYIIYSGCGWLEYNLLTNNEKEREFFKYSLHIFIIKFNNWLNSL